MPTLIPFVPSKLVVPTFTATLDGTQYSLSVTWNTSAQRYYINCFTLAGILVFSVPLVESPTELAISTLEYDNNNARVIVTCASPHWFTAGQIVRVTISSCLPNTYNGSGRALVLNRTQLAYPMTTDPGSSTLLGSVNYLFNMAAGYFNSVLVLRNSAFEVSP